MDPYFPIIFTQNIILCLVASTFVYRNTILIKREKIIFYLTLTIGLLIAICEFAYTATNGKIDLVLFQRFADYCSLTLTPLLPAIPVWVISNTKKSRICALIPAFINIIFLYSGQLFYIDSQGYYHRSSLFWIFMVCYLCSMLFLTYESLVFSRLHQNYNAVGLLFISLFMISSTTIQLRHPQIHFSWFCVTVTAILYFFYYADVVQQTDSLTGLLNRSSFKDYSTRSRKKIHSIILMDFDNFKMMNDNYGHLVGDQYLSFFSNCLLKYFSSYGSCYRMGGDEFCILLNTSIDSISIHEIIQSLEEKCQKAEGLPASFSFSYGYQNLSGNMTVTDAIKAADQYLYECKASKKKQKTKRSSMQGNVPS